MATWGDQTCQRFEATAVGPRDESQEYIEESLHFSTSFSSSAYFVIKLYKIFSEGQFACAHG